MKGAFQKIGIVFYPLGVNHFIKKPLNEIMSETCTRIDLDETFTEALQNINKTDDLEKHANILENALLQLYTPFNEEILSNSIKEIILSNGTIKITELEELLQINRKTLLRLFKKHTLTNITIIPKAIGISILKVLSLILFHADL